MADDDQALIAAANAGDVAALETLYYRYRDWVAGLAFHFTRHHEDALDVLQETFAYFFGKFPGFALTAQLKTFLYPVVRNLSLDAVRRARRERPTGELPADPPAPAPAPSAELDALLAGLAEAEREVLLLRFADGLALREIALALDIPLGTVKSRLHNALERLREDPRTKTYFEP
jgi:RNA polymerase sigma-70 factor (ECF subfamily)